MSITIELPGAAEARLARAAGRAGKSLPEYASGLLGEIAAADDSATLDEILAPLRKQVADSGMTEPELDAFFQELRQEVWDEQHGKTP